MNDIEQLWATYYQAAKLGRFPHEVIASQRRCFMIAIGLFIEMHEKERKACNPSQMLQNNKKWKTQIDAAVKAINSTFASIVLNS